MTIAWVAALVFALDRASKLLVAATMRPGESIAVVPHVFAITYTTNAGAAFNLLQHQTLFLIAVAVAVIVWVLTVGRRAARGVPGLAVALGLVLGGSVGNLVDRVRAGSVVDFLHVTGWPVSNVADMALTAGAIWFAWLLLRPQRPGPSGRDDSPA